MIFASKRTSVGESCLVRSRNGMKVGTSGLSQNRELALQTQAAAKFLTELKCNGHESHAPVTSSLLFSEIRFDE